MTEQKQPQQEPDATEFVWHPEYAGRTYESVEREIADAIRRDQSAYHLTLENAEKEEFGAFQTVRDLEKRWSQYDFGWFDVNPDALAARILSFEREREFRQELITWQDWRTQPSSPSTTGTGSRHAAPEKTDWRENLTEEQRRKLASGLAIGAMLLVVMACIAVYLLSR